MLKDVYAATARYYDLIYHWKNYRLEAAKVHWLIKSLKRSSGNELLDIACGTGGHVAYLKKHYKVVGLDNSAPMIKEARKKNPGARFEIGDMKSFRLGREFDAVVCLFSAIGYLKNHRELERALKTMASHLKPGGVLIIEPFIEPKKFKLNRPRPLEVAKTKTIELVRMTEAQQRGRKVVLDFHILVKDQLHVERFLDRHELFLFNRNEFFSAFKRAGLKGWFIKEGLMPRRGLYVAVKPVTPVTNDDKPDAPA